MPTDPKTAQPLETIRIHQANERTNDARVDSNGHRAHGFRFRDRVFGATATLVGLVMTALLARALGE